MTKDKNSRNFADYPDLLTVADLQVILNIGRTTVYKLIWDGKLRSVKIGASHRVPKTYLKDFLRENTSIAPRELSQ